MTFVSAIQQLPDAELLRIILGEESAARIANRPLMEVFRLLQAHFPLEDAETCVSLRPLTAARELLARMLNGTLSTRDANVDQGQGLLQGLGQTFIGLAGLGDTRGVVMGEDDGGGVPG